MGSKRYKKKPLHECADPVLRNLSDTGIPEIYFGSTMLNCYDANMLRCVFNSGFYVLRCVGVWLQLATGVISIGFLWLQMFVGRNF